MIRFDTVLHEIAGAFARVEALHVETAAQRSDGFTAQRITITAPDGREVSGVVWTDDHLSEAAAELAGAVEAQARQRLGGNGARALLAALAGRQLDATGSTADTIGTSAVPRSKEVSSA